MAQKAVVCCGAYDVQFAVFSGELNQLGSLLSRFPGGALDQPNKLVLHDIVRSREEASLFGLLIRTNHRQTSDSGDKLFSMDLCRQITRCPPRRHSFGLPGSVSSSTTIWIALARQVMRIRGMILFPLGYQIGCKLTSVGDRGPFRQTCEQSEMTCDA